MALIALATLEDNRRGAEKNKRSSEFLHKISTEINGSCLLHPQLDCCNEIFITPLPTSVTFYQGYKPVLLLSEDYVQTLPRIDETLLLNFGKYKTRTRITLDYVNIKIEPPQI